MEEAYLSLGLFLLVGRGFESGLMLGISNVSVIVGCRQQCLGE